MKKTSKRTGASRKRSRGHDGPLPDHTVTLLAFAGLAKAEGLRWYLFGAQAVAIYGIARTTNDIDATIDLGERSVESMIEPLRAAGFEPEFADADFAAETRVFPVRHVATGIAMDLVLAGPGLEQTFLDHAHRFRLANRVIPVIAPEHLVALKMLAGRAKDLDDVRGMIRVASKLDHERVDETLELLEEALDQSDLRPHYARLRAELTPPRTATKPRKRQR